MSLSHSALQDLTKGWTCTHPEHDGQEHQLVFVDKEKEEPYDLSQNDRRSGNALKLTIGEVMIPSQGRNNILPFSSGEKESPMVPPEQKIIPIEPGQFVYFVTEEKFRIPPYIDAELFMNPAIANRGLLFFTLGHIAPGFSGALTGTLLNMTDDTIYMKRSERLLYLMFSWAVDDPGTDLRALKEKEFNEEYYHYTHTNAADTFEEARQLTTDHPEPGFALTSDNFLTREEFYTAISLLISAFLLLLALSRLLFPT